MADDTVRRNAGWGVARIAVLVLGLAFVAIAILEVVTQDTLSPVLEYSTPLNAIHWGIGVLLLVACASGESVSRQVARIAGALLALAAIWFLVHRTAFEFTLDYPYPSPHPLPGSYIAIYGVSAMIAFLGGFWPRWPRKAGSAPAADRADRPDHAEAETP